MGQMFNTNIINNVLSIEEKMLDSINKISLLNDFSDINCYNEEIEKIKLYYKKEKYLISKIPDDIDFYNYLFEIIKDSFGLKYDNIVVSRFRNILLNNYLSLQPKYEEIDISNEDDYYEDEMFELKDKFFIRDNLIIEYLKSFNGPMSYSDEKSYIFFNRIRHYNIFLNINIFDFWVKSDFDFDKINFCTDKEIIDFLNLSKEDYYYLLNDTVSESCANLLSSVFSVDKKPKSNITVQDSFFNFKFLLKKLSTESVLAIKNEMDDVYSSIGKYGILSEIIDALDSELNIRDDYIKDNNDSLLVDSTLFDRIISLVKLEDKIYDLYNNINFNSCGNDLSKLNELIDFEKELVNDIYISSSLVVILNDLFNNNLWIYLSDSSDEKEFVISQRITNLLPFYKDLKMSPSQNMDSYNFIYKNHMIRSLKELWELKSTFDDEAIMNGFEKIYRYYYYINPELTEELLALNGNHTLLFDLPSDLSGIDALEYQYDQDEQLFNLGCEIISYIFDNENSINSVLEYCEFQFKMNELMDIISNLSLTYNKKLYRYLMDYSSIFSSLRRDIRKVFKEVFASSKVKTINK